MNETQPPPGAPAPPMSDAAWRSILWRNWIWGVGIACVILVLGLGLLVLGSLGHRHPGRDRTESVSNARQMGLALFEFETTYGRFPDDSTIALLKKQFPDTTIPLGTSSSNDYFRQLLAAEVCVSESMFFSRLPSFHRRPDNLFDGPLALEKGECGYAYIAGLSTYGNPPETPVVVAPLIAGRRIFDYDFCKKHFQSKAVILRMDNSVISLPVEKSGKVLINGKDLFDPLQPFWKGKPPDVKWPE